MDILANLNGPQRDAVLHTDGPLLLLAGAGSGKTRVITHRIAYLIREKGVSPFNILAVTFTNKAANELKRRLETLVGPQSRSIWARTFHSTCTQILRREIAAMDGYSTSFTILDSTDQEALMRQVLKTHQIDENRFRPRDVLGVIGRAKNAMQGPRELANAAQGFYEQRCAELYETYQKQLRTINALDFDDLILLTIRLFNEHEAVLKTYQNRFQYVHVDEYQDTNHSQYLLTKMLAAQHQNICVVGDDDQSIYSWRGADIRNILDFERDYRKTTVIALGENYRCSANILTAAQEVVRFNRRRRSKELFTQNPEGSRLVFYDADDERTEADYVCRVLRDHKATNGLYGECAVFYRINAMSRSFEDALRRDKIPYQIVGGVKFYERQEIKDVLSYLRILANPRDSISLLRIINVPARGIGRTTVERVQEFAQTNGLSLLTAIERCDEIESLNSRARRDLAGFLTVLRSLPRDGSLPQIIEDVLEKTGYRKDLVEQDTIESQGRLENLDEFLSAAADYQEREENPSLEGFLETVTLATDVDGMEEAGDRVTLMTLHAAKGLEFPVVVMAGMEEGLFPHQRAMNSEFELEEERRLCYVGMTRAMKHLHLTRARIRRIHGYQQETLKSRFLDEIPSHLCEEVLDRAKSSTVRGFTRTYAPEDGTRLLNATPLQPSRAATAPPPRAVSTFVPEPQTLDAYDFLRPNRRVAHAKFGAGRITRVDGRGPEMRVEVLFDDGSTKSLLAEYAKLRPI
jgi:DNA helicase-2/ATP-dependent DNA helicase PcrA